MLPGRRTADGALFVTQGPPPAGTPLVGGIAVRADGTIYVSQAFTPPFSPLDLFASGEQGAWYDPSDLTTMFQDSAGTTPVTADGQPVGLIRDKSGRNNHASQATAAKRPLYKTSGGLHWLQFDGVDDGLSTAAIDFTATDKMSLFSGTKRTTVYPQSVVVELNNINDGNSFVHFARGTSDNVVQYGVHSSGAYELQDYTDSPPPSTAVWSAQMDRAAASGNLISIRKNGTAGGSNSRADPITGNFMSGPLHVGSRDTALSMTGNIYSIIVLGRLATTQEITDTETWVAAKTGVTLP